MYSGKPVIKLGRLPPLSWVPYFKSYHIPVFISNITLKKVTLFPRFLSSWTNCSTDIELTHAEPIISVLFLSVLLLVVLLECFSWRSRPLFCRGLSLFRGIWRTFLIGDRNQVFHNIITWSEQRSIAMNHIWEYHYKIPITFTSYCTTPRMSWKKS